MGAFLSSVRLDFSHIFLLEMKKDQLGVLPNRSYHHIQRANCNFSSGIVAFARYFQLFLSVNIKRITQTLYQYLRDWMAPQVGLEPTTLRLTAECSAIELLRHVIVEIVTPLWSFESGDDLPSRAVSSQVLSACWGLTSVFGMGTGGSLRL